MENQAHEAVQSTRSDSGIEGSIAGIWPFLSYSLEPTRAPSCKMFSDVFLKVPADIGRRRRLFLDDRFRRRAKCLQVDSTLAHSSVGVGHGERMSARCQWTADF